jgi:hypothetical protein
VENTGWEGRRVEYFDVQSSEGVSLCLCQLMTDCLAPVDKIDYAVAHTRFMGPTNLVTLTVVELDDTPLYFMDDIGLV